MFTKQQDVYKCVDGKWETPPKCLSEYFLSFLIRCFIIITIIIIIILLCLKLFMIVSVIGPCEIDDFVEKYNLQTPTGKVYIRHSNKYRLHCTDG